MSKSNVLPTAYSENQLRVVSNFFDQTNALRDTFDRKMSNLYKITPQRFVWDYWHVPGQYTYFRTPARQFFPTAIFKAFIHQLKEWGAQNLGCDSVTMPWLSYYINGSRQELHMDTPNGPWAFVFSLTQWKTKAFTGGETIFLNPACLNYWKNYSTFQSLGTKSLVQTIPARFNQLVVFDSRIPHGVKQVEGTYNPLESRIVLHGWFQEPKIRLTGSRDLSEVRQFLAGQWSLLTEAQLHKPVAGSVVLRILIDADGTALLQAIPTNNLVATTGDDQSYEQVLEGITHWVHLLKFPKSSGLSTLTLPLKWPLKATFH